MQKLFLYSLLTLSVIQVFSQKNNEYIQYEWPIGFDSAHRRFFVYNEINIRATPDKVWALLTNIERWPEWYAGAKDVSLSDQSTRVLTSGSVFNWKTMGMRFKSTIHRFEPPNFLSWESRKRSIKGYHIWLIRPTHDGCIVITAEAQTGWLTFFEKIFQPRKLQRLHQVWLQQMKEQLEATSDKTEQQ